MRSLLESCTQLSDLASKAELMNTTRTAVAIDETLEKALQEKLLFDAPQNVLNAYADIVVTSKAIAANYDKFTHNPLQCYMAAVAACSPTKQHMTLSRPGSGKTFVFLHLANYLLTKNEICQVVIFIQAGL